MRNIRKEGRRLCPTVFFVYLTIILIILTIIVVKRKNMLYIGFEEEDTSEKSFKGTSGTRRMESNGACKES